MSIGATITIIMVWAGLISLSIYFARKTKKNPKTLGESYSGEIDIFDAKAGRSDEQDAIDKEIEEVVKNISNMYPPEISYMIATKLLDEVQKDYNNAINQSFTNNKGE